MNASERQGEPQQGAPPVAPQPGAPDNPIDVDTDDPVVYLEGSVRGAAVDLTEGEEDPLCFICQDVKHEGAFCNQRQGCCGAQCHSVCFRPWLRMQQQQFGNVACPMCRSILLS